MFTKARQLLATTLLTTIVGSAFASNYPTSPITVVTPFPAGGATDALARVIAEHMGSTLGQNLIVENKAGAATNIGASYTARQKPDGYTLLLATNSTLVTNRFLFKELAYDPDAFAPIGMIGIGPMVLLANKSHGFKSVDDVVKAAQQQPGKLNIASFGAGTSSHLAAEHFQDLSGTRLTHIPFKGTTQAMPQLIAGEVDVFFDMVSTGMPQVNANKVDALAVTSPKRLSNLPNLPTVAEAGFPNYEMTAWFTLVAPPNTPETITSTLSSALQKALTDPKVRQRMLDMGLEPSDGTPQAIARQIQKESPVIANLVKKANIPIQ